jgi:hypothetical protein
MGIGSGELRAHVHGGAPEQRYPGRESPKGAWKAGGAHEELGLPAFPATGHCPALFGFSGWGYFSFPSVCFQTRRKNKIPKALPEEEGPRPDGCGPSQEGVGDMRTKHKGSAAERGEETGRAAVPRLPHRARARLARSPPPPRRPPKAQPACERKQNTIITYNGIVSCAGTAQSLPPRNRRRCRPGHDPLRREGGGGACLSPGSNPTPAPAPAALSASPPSPSS